MKRLLYLILGATLLTSACQREVLDNTDTQQSVSFLCDFDHQTRVDGNNFETGDDIGVSAYSDVALTESYADNVKYEYNNGQFTSSTPINYELRNDEELTFRAVYPYKSGRGETFSFTVKTNQSFGDNFSLSDLMVAQTEATSLATPTLTFSRKLSQITFNVKDEDGKAITDANVYAWGYTSVDANLANDTFVASGSKQKITATNAGGGAYKIIIPAQTIAALTDFVSVEVGDQTITEQLSDPFELESGDGYKYAITIEQEPVTPPPTEKYEDGEVTTLQTESAGARNPVHLIITGDGYTESDYVSGGKFDQDVETAVDAFFGLEPYITYRNYFRISTVAAYSAQSGATVLSAMTGASKQTRNTIFSSELEGGYSTGISCDYDKVYEYAKKVPGVSDRQLKGTVVLMLINLDVYAGTCMMEYYGRGIAMCPAGRSSLSNIVQHECGGHGFGRLLDEYRYYNEYAPSSEEDQVDQWRGADPYYGNNLDYTGSRTQVHWKDYFSRSGYSAVDLIEGGGLYYKGVWRPEQISCMEDNRSYYNAPSREAIVRRIFKTSGSTFNINDFLAKDVVKSDPTRVQSRTMVMPPLGRPVLIDNRK